MDDKWGVVMLLVVMWNKVVVESKTLDDGRRRRMEEVEG
jgi:hypothetical protein